jgi:predicted dehydrogenase
MSSRRKFIRQVGGMTSMAAMSGIPFAMIPVRGPEAVKEKTICIGIIGAENSHTIEYGRIFNIEKKFPGVDLRYVWGETPELAQVAAREGNIPVIVKDPLEMLGKIDALIVDHRHATYHLPAALPFVKAGIPCFIDKPFCYRLEEGQRFFEEARRAGTAVTSYSSVSQSSKTADMAAQVAKLTDISQILMTGPADPDSIYGGIFFYGIHMVQPLITIFGEGIEKVRFTRSGKNSGAHLVYRDGRLVTFIFTDHSNGWETWVVRPEGFFRLESNVQEPDPGKNYADMVEMFRTGKEPLSHASILTSVAVLEALERSVSSDRWEAVSSVAV